MTHHPVLRDPGYKRADEIAKQRAVREALVQGALVDFVRAVLPEAWITAIPGGDGRATRAVGYVSGAPDLVMVFRGRAFFIETKRPGRGAEAHQRLCHADIARAGCATAVCRSVEELQAALLEWGLPIRGRV